MLELKSKNDEKTVHTCKFYDKQHFRYIKGIAILLVLIGHAGNNSGVTYFTPLGGIGVALFLFCAGYGNYFSLSSKRGVLDESIAECIS